MATNKKKVLLTESFAASGMALRVACFRFARGGRDVDLAITCAQAFSSGTKHGRPGRATLRFGRCGRCALAADCGQ